jgi:hypothetical protein
MTRLNPRFASGEPKGDNNSSRILHDAYKSIELHRGYQRERALLNLNNERGG